jgi:hypothetical protein
MAYGQFTGYEPAPDVPGAYNFARANGAPLTFGGQEAEQLKARLDAYNSVNQPKVAGPGGAPPPEDDAPVPPPAGAGYAPPDAPAQPTGPRPVMVNGINTGYVQGPDGRLMEYVPGSAGTSREQLQKKSTQGTALPTAESRSVTGAFEPNKEYQEARRAASGVERGALERGRSAELLAEEEGRRVAQEQFVTQTAQVREQQGLVDRVNAQVNEAQMRRDQALKDYSGAKVDPDRIFSGDFGGVRRIGSAIAAAMGAYAATVGKTQNFAQQIIDNQISRDIAAQEADIRIKKDRSDTALGDLVRRGMTLEQAKGTLGSIQRDWAKNQVALARGASSNEAINAKYDALVGKFDKDTLDEGEAYLKDARGTATQAVQSQVVYPQAGSAGGLREVAPGKALAIAGQTAGTEGQVAGTAKTLTELNGGNSKRFNPEARKADAAMGAIDSSLKTLEKYQDEELPEITANQSLPTRAWRGAKDFVGGAGTSGRDMDEKQRALIQDTEQAKLDIMAMNSVLNQQGAMTDAEREAAEKGLAPGATVGDIRRAALKLKAKVQSIQGAVAPNNGAGEPPPPQQ